MATAPDLLYVALFALVLPLVDYAYFWPAFRRRSAADPAGARRWFYAWAIFGAWPAVAIGAVLWTANGRSWVAFGLSVPDGWRFWAAVALVLLVAVYFAYAAATVARSSETRESVRRQIGGLDSILPHTRTEMCWFGGVSLTAGFCEEFLFRGYFIWVLAPWLGWWGAAALSVLVFGALHAYQGWTGILRTGIVGAVFTLVVALFGSLWPAIALHALVDLGNGTASWLALREGPAAGQEEGGMAE